MDTSLPKVSLKIVGTMQVGNLKTQFRDAFGGTLRVYNKNIRAEDGAFLFAIRNNEGARGGELVCQDSCTVGDFEKEMWNVFGIKIQVASPDDWVLALDGITLGRVKDIPKNSTKASMETLL